MDKAHTVRGRKQYLGLEILEHFHKQGELEMYGDFLRISKFISSKWDERVKVDRWQEHILLTTAFFLWELMRNCRMMNFAPQSHLMRSESIAGDGIPSS